MPRNHVGWANYCHHVSSMTTATIGTTNKQSSENLLLKTMWVELIVTGMG